MTKSKLRIFKNEKVGQPIKKKDGTIVEYNGEPMLHCALDGKINLPEGLPAGDYAVAIYQCTSKAGLKYYSGTIKPDFKQKYIAADGQKLPYQAKAKTLDEAVDDFGSDDIPF
jgi:hypothetical protein